MVRFKGMDRVDVSDRTARFHFGEIPGNPWLEVRTATQSNPGYFNAMLRRDAEIAESNGSTTIRVGRTRGRRPDSDMSVEELEKVRESDRKLYARHVVVGMGGWKDEETDKEVPYARDVVEDLLSQLTDNLFDQLRAFCNNDTNFMDDPPLTKDEVEVVEGN